MIHKNLFYFLILLFLSSCGGSKLSQYFKEGKTLESNYLTTVPLKFNNGLIIVEVTIDNSNYNFIVDTGATNIISKELAKKLNLNILGSEEVSDIQGAIQEMGYAKIDSLSLGGIHFLDTTTGISDFFTEIFPYKCLKIDGIIGSNLMQHAIWDFDFKNQMIHVTDSENKLDIPSNFKESKMYIGYGGIPSITSFVNGSKIYNNVIDFGFDGGIVIPISEFKKQMGNGSIKNFVQGFGNMPIGAFGKTESNDFYTSKIDEIKFGDFIVKDKLVYSDRTITNRLGLDFFKDYRIILNWNKGKIKLVSNQTIVKDTYSSFGYAVSQEKEDIVITSLIKGSNAAKHLKIGDKVLSIDEKDFSSILEADQCKIWEEGFVNKSQVRINISILRNGEIFKYKLEKTDFL